MEVRDFMLNGRVGCLAISYQPNEDIEQSGFDMFDPNDFDPAVALGYPTMHVWVDHYDGTGYRTSSAFIQWIDTRRKGSSLSDVRELDVGDTFRRAKIPYFSVGYPANLYDAPAHNLHGASWMRWLATTWFVTLPARWTNNEIRPLVGCQWGYEEDAQRGVEVLPLRDLAPDDWTKVTQWLGGLCPGFSFGHA